MIYDLIYVFGVIVLAGILWALLARAPFDGEIKRWGQWVILAVAAIILFIILFRLVLSSVATVT